MRLGLAIPQYGDFADPELSARLSLAAEEMGYDSLWVGDRLLTPVRPRNPYPGGDGSIPPEHRLFLDPLTVLTVAAGATRRVRLGTSTLNAFWQPPVVLARALTSLDIVSGGRLDAGLGLGWSRDEYEAAGVPWRGRGARMEETLDVLERIWGDGETVEHVGAHWTIPESTALPKPVQRPRPGLLLGGFGAGALDRVARRADGWLGAALPLPYLGQVWQGVRDRAAGLGRDPDALRLVLRVNPKITAGPAAPDRVPHEGTLDQLVGYLAAAVTDLGAEPLIDLHHTAADPEDFHRLAKDLHTRLHETVGR